MKLSEESVIKIFIFLAILVPLLLLDWFRNRSRNRGKVTPSKHAYFSRLWLLPADRSTRWEAEFDTASEWAHDGTIALSAEDNGQMARTADPTKEEIAFSKKCLSDLARLLPIAKEGLEQGWKEWFKEELPPNWEKEFKVNGFSVPVGGDIANHWEITFYCPKANHYFNVEIEKRKSKLISIDG